MNTKILTQKGLIWVADRKTYLIEVLERKEYQILISH